LRDRRAVSQAEAAFETRAQGEIADRLVNQEAKPRVPVSVVHEAVGSLPAVVEALISQVDLSVERDDAERSAESKRSFKDVGLDRGIGLMIVFVNFIVFPAVWQSLLRRCVGADKENQSGAAMQ